MRTFKCFCGSDVIIPEEYKHDFTNYNHALYCDNPNCFRISIFVHGALMVQYNPSTLPHVQFDRTRPTVLVDARITIDDALIFEGSLEPPSLYPGPDCTAEMHQVYFNPETHRIKIRKTKLSVLAMYDGTDPLSWWVY